MEEGNEAFDVGAGDTTEAGTEGKEEENLPQDTEGTEPGFEGTENAQENKGEVEELEGEHVEGEHVEGEHVEGEHVEGEHVEGEHVEGEHLEGEHVEGEELEGEHVAGEHVEDEEKVLGEGEELEGEHLEGEETEQKEEVKAAEEEQVEEEQAYVVEPPPDPSAPLDLSDSKEAIREPFDLRPDQLAEVEQLWELYQNYTPAYTDIDEYITEKELIYMLKSLLLMTYTPEQFQELIEFCVRPPHPEGHIIYEQFLRIVKIRQRDFPVDEEIRAAFQVLDPDKTGLVDREYLREVLAKYGHKMPQRHLDNLIKEVDMTNDGTIGIDDAVGTMCIDLNPDDLLMLKEAIFGSQKPDDEGEENMD